MPIVQLQDGTKISFAKTPTPAEVDFAYKKLQERKSSQATQTPQVTPEDKPGYFERVGGEYYNAAKDIKRAVTADQNPLSAGLQTAGAFAKAVFAPITEAVAPVIEAGLETETGKAVAEDIGAIVNEPIVQENLAKYREWASANPEAAKNLEASVNIGGLVFGEKPVQQALQKTVDVGTDAANVALKTVAGAADSVPAAAGKVSGFVSPKKDIQGAIGQVTQAKPADMKALTRAFSAVDEATGKTVLDVSNVPTYQALDARIRETIPTLAKKVDEAFAKDPNPYSLPNLAVRETTKGGQTVVTDYVSKALKDLGELYRATNDEVSRANTIEMLAMARQKGLTRKQVNDIARAYGQEFGQKAFSPKTGEALTSVNAQSFENTRKGLKSVARAGMDATAKNIDQQMSDLFTLQLYTKKLVDGVAKIKNKIDERSLGAKFGHALVKGLDLVTGGIVRGAVAGALPRGVGYKVFNALDLEKKLQRNLATIEEALSAGSDDSFVAAVKKLESPQLPKATTFERSPIVSTVKTAVQDMRDAKTPKQKSGGFIKNPLADKKKVGSSLADEAKKYKTADQFIEDQISKETGFRDTHSAPRRDTSPVEARVKDGGSFSLAEVSNGFSTQPDDYFDSSVGARYYGYDNPEGMESYRAIKEVMDGKSMNIVAYRSVPKDVKATMLEDGDWVTFSKKYAENHGEARFNGDYKIIEQRVSPRDVWWDGNDINEWGFDSGTSAGRVTQTERRKQLRDIWEKSQAPDSRSVLLKEAKKYKNAEDFVASQKSIYHGTDKKFSKFDTNRMEGGVAYFTDNVKDFEGGNATGSVGTSIKMERFLKPGIKLANSSEYENLSTAQLIERGYAGSKIEQGDSVWYEIFNPNEDLLTKRQLLEIYRDANKK